MSGLVCFLMFSNTEVDDDSGPGIIYGNGTCRRFPGR